MGSIQFYPIEFIKRTNEILTEDYHHFEPKEREVTFLMNCLLGLIVTVSENENRKLEVFKGEIDDHFLTLIPKKIGFIETESLVGNSVDLTDISVTELNVPVGHWDDLKRKTKFWFLNKIRNGITHQHIEGVNKEGKWVGVRLWNEPNPKKRDFEIIFTIKQLKNFAIKLSDKYSAETNQQS